MVMKNPGDTVIVTSTIINTGNVTHTFKYGVSIGNKPLEKWYDVGWFNDGFGDYRDVTLAPGASAAVTRTLEMPDDTDVTDAAVSVRAEDLTVLAVQDLLGVIDLPAISATITNVIVT